MRLAATLLLGFRALAVVPLVASCHPRDDAYIAPALAFVEEGCCSRDHAKVDAPCDRCAVLVETHVTKAKVAEGCANDCKMVALELDGPNGPGICLVQVNEAKPLHFATGGCHATTSRDHAAPTDAANVRTVDAAIADRGGSPPPMVHVGKSYGLRSRIEPGVPVSADVWMRDHRVTRWDHDRCWSLRGGTWSNECDCRRSVALGPPANVDLLACERARAPDDAAGQSRCYVVGRTLLYAASSGTMRVVLDIPTSTWTLDEGCEGFGPHGLWLGWSVDGADVVVGEASTCAEALAEIGAPAADGTGVDSRERKLARAVFRGMCQATGRWRWRNGSLAHLP